MSLRLSAEEARALAAKLPARSGRAIRAALATPSKHPSIGQCAAPRRGARPSNDPGAPQAKLFELLSRAFPHAVSNYTGAIPGRRYEIDIAFPHPERVAVEVDGWEFHGKHLKDFLRDRAKRNLLALRGWVILAYPARDVNREPERLVREVGMALAMARERMEAEAGHTPEVL